MLAGDRLYTSINIFGLAIGLTTGFLIFLWVSLELNYDQYKDHERIFRVTSGWDESDESFSSTYPMMKEKVLSRFPEIEGTVRLYNPQLQGSKTRTATGEKIFTDSKVFYGDSTFFNLFPFEILKGSKQHLFDAPNAVILTEETAAIYFSNSDPIGKTILLNNSKELVVTGVMQNLPSTNHFNFDMLVSMDSHPWVKGAEESLWSGIVFHTYIKVKEGADVKSLNAKINDFMDHFPEDPEGYGRAMKITLQPVNDIHLQSHMRWELQPNGNSTYVYLFITIAVLVIVVACINYINLSTARYTKRVKEVGIRKVMGAMRKQLIFQFLSESIIIAFVAFLISIVLVQLSLPWMEQTTGQVFTAEVLYYGRVGLVFLGIVLLVGVGSGFFPAIVLSNFKPIRLFKPVFSFSSSGNTLRKSLVVFQFAISIILSICTVVTFKQLKFIQTTDLGFDKEQVLSLPIRYAEVLPRYREFKAALLTGSDILGAAATSQLPTNIIEGENIDVDDANAHEVYYVSVDQDFFRVMGINIRSGKYKIEGVMPQEGINLFVLNENAVKEIGWSDNDAVGKTMRIRHGNMEMGEVLGVADDFHFQSLHENIRPLAIEFNPEMYQYLLIKIAPGKSREAVAFVQEQWKKFAGNVPFDYNFLDQQYDQLYKNEERMGSLFVVFASIASIIALLGLYGLASFAVEKRTKEIGIRKVFGASVPSIIKILVKDFSGVLLVAFAIAIPVSFYYSVEWLQTFAYHTTLTPYVFVIAGLLNVALAVITLLYHGIKASANNPIISLRSE
jgi:putative ABC transport system permease protein